jgi:RHS repeat-associated protein
VRTTYAYDPLDRQLATLKSRLPDGHHFQNISYTYDNVGNITRLRNDVPLPHGKPIGGPSTQTYTYDDLYRLTSARGEYTYADNKLDRYSLDQTYDSIHNILSKDQRHEIVVNPGGTAQAAQSYQLSSDPELARVPAGGGAGFTADSVVTDPLTEPAPVTQEELYPPLGVIEEPADDEAVALPPAGELSGTQKLGSADTRSASLAAAGTQANVQPQRKTSYEYDYAFTGAKPHAPSRIGPIDQAYDANGNLVDTVNTMPPSPGKRRQMVWDEENRLACNQDHNRNSTLAQDPSSCTNPKQPATVRYHYDADGTRVVKNAGPQHIYPNQYFSERNGTGFKHVYAGETRLATKTVKPAPAYENHIFYFHADHLGSSGYVTDEHAGLTEHVEYFASGETWVMEHPGQPTPVPYRFGAKELDEETGLYYHGARYYNPRTSVWQSTDPILGSYLDGKPAGGVQNSANLALYSYAHNNPVKYTDPDGLAPDPVTLGDELMGSRYLTTTITERVPVTRTVTARGGWAVFRPALVAGGVASQVDTPAPGPGDLIGIGIIVAGGIAALQSTTVSSTTTIETVTRTERKEQQLWYITYQKYNAATGKYYSGRASGYGTPQQVLAQRDSGHHMDAAGFGPAELTSAAQATMSYSLRHADPAYQAIRGREQQMIDYRGGSSSDGGTSGNAIRGVAKLNPLGRIYHNASTARFGPMHPYTGY